jgi:dipeptidyl aminopeptidase/acylaminoacyl peptidase
VQALQARDDVRHEHVGLFGFSFGATQGLVAAAQPGTARLLSGMAAWGGYCDLHRLFRFGLTGLHEIDGVTYRTRPDPYGAWIIAGNYLSAGAGPRPSLPLLRVPTLFAHGRDDRLIPFSESILLSRAVPARFMRDLTITALFQHSGGTQSGLGAAGLAREGMRFVRLLRRVLALV